MKVQSFSLCNTFSLLMYINKERRERESKQVDKGNEQASTEKGEGKQAGTPNNTARYASLQRRVESVSPWHDDLIVAATTFFPLFLLFFFVSWSCGRGPDVRTQHGMGERRSGQMYGIRSVPRAMARRRRSRSVAVPQRNLQGQEEEQRKERTNEMSREKNKTEQPNTGCVLFQKARRRRSAAAVTTTVALPCARHWSR